MPSSVTAYHLHSTRHNTLRRCKSRNPLRPSTAAVTIAAAVVGPSVKARTTSCAGRPSHRPSTNSISRLNPFARAKYPDQRVAPQHRRHRVTTVASG